MRRIRPPVRLLLPLLLAAACRDGGGGVIVAGVNDLRMDIVAGKGIVSQVRPAGVEDADSAVVQQPITVRITVSPDRLEEAGATGPDPRLSIPPVEIRWRALESWCEPVLEVTPVGAGADSVSNHVRRPTVAANCHLLAEAVADGRVFGTDTSVVSFAPGPAVTIVTLPHLAWPFRQRLPMILAVNAIQDAYGNYDTLPVFSIAIIRGAPLITKVDDQTIRASGETAGEVELSFGAIGRRVEVWALEEMRRPWLLAWACYGGAGAGGAQIDSVHYHFDAAAGRYGAFSGPGVAVTFEGSRTDTTWIAGQPPRETVVPGTTFPAVQRPGLLEWSPGQVAPATGTSTGYLGGTLCAAPAGGGAWARTSPVSVLPV
jgi:hypothetical protein